MEHVRWQYSRANWEGLNDDLARYDWDTVLGDTSDVDTAAKKLLSHSD